MKFNKTITMDMNLAQAVNLISKKRGVSFSRVIIWAVTAYIKSEAVKDIQGLDND